ncbi:helix-turn-helix domain-containing protein [Cohnella pontilimi]|uniref:Helix-turn-helix domain-containing protein n=1 Tax=Cohnella pontilimi TaxID=2564100 RepID=A0A4U0FI52_9BACL|nr:helix-turn-helix domain-containing protein [Cohnella pontilimi]TJY43122.1 helix-turn-helix domain-containing protein [Cohnella pontilimi]
MSDLGALLRKAREQKGYTLDDVQEATKIRKRYLEAIETGDYSVLPGSFYVRAFVKTYAETVGLDAEEVLRLYQKELPKTSTDAPPPVEPMLKSSRRSSGQHSDRWGKVSATLLMWLFPILIVAVLYVYLSNNNASKGPKELDPNKITNETAVPPNSASPSAPPASPSGSAASPSPSASVSPSPSAVTLTLSRTRGGVSYYDVGPAGPHQVQLEVTGTCWVGVYEKGPKGKQLYSKSYQTADVPSTISFDMTGPLYISVGRADNAKVMVDGTLVDDGDKAGAARFLFTPAAAAQ